MVFPLFVEQPCSAADATVYDRDSERGKRQLGRSAGESKQLFTSNDYAVYEVMSSSLIDIRQTVRMTHRYPVDSVADLSAVCQ